VPSLNSVGSVSSLFGVVAVVVVSSVILWMGGGVFERR